MDIESFLSQVRNPPLSPQFKVDAGHLAAAMTLLGIHDPRKPAERKELCVALARFAYAVWRDS